MVDLDNYNLSILKLYDNEFITFWIKEKDQKNYTLIDSIEYDKKYMDIIDIKNMIKEVYYYNKNDNNNIYINFTIKKSEL